MQFIFQDRLSVLNPRHRIEDILAQPLLACGRVGSRAAGRREDRPPLDVLPPPDLDLAWIMRDDDVDAERAPEIA